MTFKVTDNQYGSYPSDSWVFLFIVETDEDKIMFIRTRRLSNTLR